MGGHGAVLLRLSLEEYKKGIFRNSLYGIIQCLFSSTLY